MCLFPNKPAPAAAKDRRMSSRPDLRIRTRHISTRCRPGCRRHHLPRHCAHILAYDVLPSVDGASEHDAVLRGAHLRQRLARLRTGALAHAAPPITARAGDRGVWWNWNRISHNNADHRRTRRGGNPPLCFRPFLGAACRQLREDDQAGAGHRRGFDAVFERRPSLIQLDAPLRSDGFAFLVLTPWDARQRSMNVVNRSIISTLGGNAVAHTSVIDPNCLAGGRAPGLFVVRMAGKYEPRFIYLFLVVQFESFDDPVIVLITMP